MDTNRPAWRRLATAALALAAAWLRWKWADFRERAEGGRHGATSAKLTVCLCRMQIKAIQLELAMKRAIAAFTAAAEVAS